MKKILLLIFIFLVMISGFGIKKIDFAVFNAPPYLFDNNGKAEGILIDFYDEVLNLIGYKPNYRFFPLLRQQMYVEAGSFSIGLGTNTTANDKVNYIPIMKIARVIFHHKDIKFDYDYKNLKSIEKYKITLIAGGDVQKYFEKNNILYNRSNTYQELIAKVYEKRVDIAVVPDMIPQTIIKKHYPGKENMFVIEKNPLFMADAGIFVSKKNKEWEKISVEIEKSIEKVMENGTYNKLLEKYFGKGNIPEYMKLK